jgi:hypothetical protein
MRASSQNPNSRSRSLTSGAAESCLMHTTSPARIRLSGQTWGTAHWPSSTRNGGVGSCFTDGKLGRLRLSCKKEFAPAWWSSVGCVRRPSNPPNPTGFEKAHAWPVPTAQTRRIGQAPTARPKMQLSPGTTHALACPDETRRSLRPLTVGLRRSSLAGRSPVSSGFEYYVPPQAPQAC